MMDGTMRLYLRDVFVEPWKAAATSVSIAIMRSLFSATFSFRAVIWFFTQPLNRPPSTVAQTLQMYSLPTLWISCWSGR